MKFRIGDAVKIVPNAVLANGRPVPENAINIKVFVRDIQDGQYVIGRTMNGALLGVLPEKFVKHFLENEAVIKPYAIQVLDDDFPVYHSPSKTSGIIRRVDNTSLFMIIDERNGFGKLQIGAGWVELAKVKSFKK